MKYIRNLETEKLELHLDKSFWQSLPDETKKKVKSNFLWSRSRKAWVSRAKYPYCRALDIAKELGLEDGGEEGERLSFEEKKEAELEKAGVKAERYEAKAQKIKSEASSRFSEADRISSYIPFGQPILVGHHSEKRHRSALKKIDNNMRKGIELTDKAEYYNDKAASLREKVEGRYNKEFCSRRIEDAEKDIRLFNKYLSRQCSEGVKAHYEKLKKEAEEKKAYYLKQIDEMGCEQYTKEKLKGAKYIKRRGQWYEIIRLNQKTVTHSWFVGTWKTPYGEIQDVKY